MPQGVVARIQRAMHFFLPREQEFFGIFVGMAQRAHEAALLLQQLFRQHPDLGDLVSRIDALEEEVDTLRHDCVQRLHDTFVTPIMFDRQDIFDLADMLDDVMDFVKAAADRTRLYEVKQVPGAMLKLTDILVEATGQLRDACQCLDSLRPQECGFVHRVNDLENQADYVLKQALADLFQREPDPVEIIKWKEIYDYVEEAIDHCEDTANLIEGALVKNA